MHTPQPVSIEIFLNIIVCKTEQTATIRCFVCDYQIKNRNQQPKAICGKWCAANWEHAYNCTYGRQIYGKKTEWKMKINAIWEFWAGCATDWLSAARMDFLIHICGVNVGYCCTHSLIHSLSWSHSRAKKKKNKTNARTELYDNLVSRLFILLLALVSVALVHC